MALHSWVGLFSVNLPQVHAYFMRGHTLGIWNGHTTFPLLIFSRPKTFTGLDSWPKKACCCLTYKLLVFSKWLKSSWFNTVGWELISRLSSPLEQRWSSSFWKSFIILGYSCESQATLSYNLGRCLHTVIQFLLKSSKKGKLKKQNPEMGLSWQSNGCRCCCC